MINNILKSNYMKKNLKNLILIVNLILIAVLLLSTFLVLNNSYQAQEYIKSSTVATLNDTPVENAKEESKQDDKAKSSINKTGLITLIVFISLLFIVFIILIFVRPKELLDDDYKKAIENKEKRKFEREEKKRLKKENKMQSKTENKEEKEKAH